MTTLREQIALDMAGIITDLSEEITYTPGVGEAKDINALIMSVDTEPEDDDLGEMSVKRRRIVILTDAVKGIASPKINDIVTISDDDWRVLSIDAQGFGKATLSVVLGETISKHHEQHKKKF